MSETFRVILHQKQVNLSGIKAKTMMMTTTPLWANFTPIKLSVNALLLHFTTRFPVGFDISAGEDQTWFQCPQTSQGQDDIHQCGQDLQEAFPQWSASAPSPQVACKQ